MHGGDIYRHPVELDFSVNTNPLGMPEGVRQALVHAVEKAEHYPDPAAEELTRRLAARYRVPAERIVCGNGASELITAVMQAFRPGKLMLFDPCFSGYERAFSSVRTESGSGMKPDTGSEMLSEMKLKGKTGGRIGETVSVMEKNEASGSYTICKKKRKEQGETKTKTKAGAKTECKGMTSKNISHVLMAEENGFRPASYCLGDIRLEKPDMIFFTNPGNPSGAIVSKSLMLESAEAMAAHGGITVVDECFLELTDRFQEYSVLRSVGEQPGLFVLNAFTKTYAIPGVRLGFLICPSGEDAGRIRMALPEWNLSVFAQSAGIAAMGTPPDYLEKAREVIGSQRSYMTERLREMGLLVCESEACYLLFYANPDAHLYERLLEKKILIRDCSDYRGLGSGWYRIAVRRKEENKRLLEQMDEILKEMISKNENR